jgi:hypothetical protein
MKKIYLIMSPCGCPDESCRFRKIHKAFLFPINAKNYLKTHTNCWIEEREIDDYEIIKNVMEIIKNDPLMTMRGCEKHGCMWNGDEIGCPLCLGEKQVG